jgi:hypothetical protein
MPRQLNIRSDEAYEIAHRAAKQSGKTVTEVVTNALRQQHGAATPVREVPSEVASETFRVLKELSREGARLKRPGATSDHSDMYDEYGLPI